jgi:hypothetical protein
VRIDADPAGLAGLADAYGPLGERMNRLLDGCSTDDLRVVLSFMKAGREAADAEIARIREQGIRHATRRSAGAAPGAALSAAPGAATAGRAGPAKGHCEVRIWPAAVRVLGARQPRRDNTLGRYGG